MLIGRLRERDRWWTYMGDHDIPKHHDVHHSLAGENNTIHKSDAPKVQTDGFDFQENFPRSRFGRLKLDDTERVGAGM